MYNHSLSGDNGKEVTPVPMPNTEVKLLSADGSRRRSARVGRCQANRICDEPIESSSVVELSAVNRSVVGSNPTCGAMALVKRLRHRPFTAVTRVRVRRSHHYWRISSAGRASALQAEGRRFEPSFSTICMSEG